MAGPTPKVLLIEDEASQRALLSYNLQAEGFAVVEAGDGEEGLLLVEEEAPDLILLDWMLPGLSGIEVCRRLKTRTETRAVPIIMLSARSEEVDRVRGLETGADDYMVKPFRHPSELIARIRTRLRRTNADVLGLLTIGDLSIDVTAHEVARGGKKIALTRLEFDLLVALAKEPGRVFTRDALLGEVWGYRHSTDTRLVNVHVQRLRSKIEHDPEHPEIVMTVRGVGYKAGVMGGS